MSEIIFKRTCARCGNELDYVSHTYFNQLLEKNPTHCKICKPVTDASLENLKTLQQYTRTCSICNRTVVYRNRTSYRQACIITNPCVCKSCGNLRSPKRAEREKQLREQWEPIIGRWPVKYKTFVMIRRHWMGLNEQERQNILDKTELQKYYYWGHLRRWNRNAGHRKCREVIAEKYSGENHWMKRPEVIAKVKKTCEKYRGDGHWFRRNKKS